MKVTVVLRRTPKNITRIYLDANNCSISDGMVRVECGYLPPRAGEFWLHARDIHLFALDSVVEVHQENIDASEIFKPDAEPPPNAHVPSQPPQGGIQDC